VVIAKITIKFRGERMDRVNDFKCFKCEKKLRCDCSAEVSESTETAGYAAEINADAREATARQTFKAMTNTDRPDIAIAILLRAIDEWYETGVDHGKRA
jgi:hypothetical protein